MTHEEVVKEAKKILGGDSWARAEYVENGSVDAEGCYRITCNLGYWEGTGFVECLMLMREQEPKDVPQVVPGKFVGEARRIVVEGLTTDGDHHKQWYLEQIAEKLGVDLSGLDYTKGITP